MTSKIIKDENGELKYKCERSPCKEKGTWHKEFFRGKPSKTFIKHFPEDESSPKGSVSDGPGISADVKPTGSATETNFKPLNEKPSPEVEGPNSPVDVHGKEDLPSDEECDHCFYIEGKKKCDHLGSEKCRWKKGDDGAYVPKNEGEIGKVGTKTKEDLIQEIKEVNVKDDKYIRAFAKNIVENHVVVNEHGEQALWRLDGWEVSHAEIKFFTIEEKDLFDPIIAFACNEPFKKKRKRKWMRAIKKFTV